MRARINFFFLNHLIKQDAKYFQTRRQPLFTAVRVVHLNQSNMYTTTLSSKQVARKVLFPPCLMEHIALSPIKMI